MRTGAQSTLVLIILFVLAGCASTPLASVPLAERDSIAANLTRDINRLASDEFGGRLPGTPSEKLTLDYIADGFRAAGLESGTNDPGNAWRAPVRLVRTRPLASRVAIFRDDEEVGFSGEAGVAFTSRRLALIEQGDVIFVGYQSEAVAEERVTGKIVVMLGEPGASPARREALFGKNPAAIITVVDDLLAMAEIRADRDRERWLLASDENDGVSAYVANNAFAEAIGTELWNALREEAEQPGFDARDLDIKARVEASSQRRDFVTYNVIGRLPGTIPNSGAVLMLAHWDHLGECGDDAAGDLICNGAVDNASGIAVMLELARRLSASEPFDRDIYFVATSAEEAGLLGARAFVDEPPVPLDTVVAAFNFDTMAVAPAGSSVGFVGEGRTPLDSVITEIMAGAKRELGNRDFADSFLQRLDSWILLQEGVPAVSLSSTFGSEITISAYLSERYHQPGDEAGTIELGGAIDDLLLHEELVRRIADTTLYPANGG
ncbi:MAG: M20/M25/M40 family metallo-hydrolase [Pseudomonadota bacterium]